MNIQVTPYGFEIEDPSEVHECGPSGPHLIDDALSHARSHFINGVNILWIWENYKESLLEMVRKKYWRSRDALAYYVFLERMAVEACSSHFANTQKISFPQ